MEYHGLIKFSALSGEGMSNLRARLGFHPEFLRGYAFEVSYKESSERSLEVDVIVEGHRGIRYIVRSTHDENYSSTNALHVQRLLTPTVSSRVIDSTLNILEEAHGKKLIGTGEFYGLLHNLYMDLGTIKSCLIHYLPSKMKRKALKRQVQPYQQKKDRVFARAAELSELLQG